MHKTVLACADSEIFARGGGGGGGVRPNCQKTALTTFFSFSSFLVLNLFDSCT